MGRARVVWHADAVEDMVIGKLMSNGEAVGQDLATKISGRAPRSAGAGNLPGGGHAADAVTWEVEEIPEGVRISVGYQRRAFYMYFAEKGTSRQAATPTVLPTVIENKASIIRLLCRG